MAVRRMSPALASELVSLSRRLATASTYLGLFLLPGGRPLRLTFVIQAGGRPRRRPRPTASRSNVMIASSICSRSARNSGNHLRYVHVWSLR